MADSVAAPLVVASPARTLSPLPAGRELPRDMTGANDLARVEAEIARRPLFRLPFAEAIEDRYEADTKAARAWNIRLTVPMGLVSYNAFSFVDFSLLPDLGSIPTLLRLFLITPVGLFAMWMCTRYGAAFREAFISLAITATLLIPVGFVALSKSPLAPYTMLPVLLVSMFGNITMRIRFHWACLFSLLTIGGVGAMLWMRTDLDAGLSGAVLISIVTCVSFGIVANNQLERAERHAFLLALRETLRAERLSADKDAYSALSLSDALTGLANRRAFDAAFDVCLAEWSATGEPFCVVMVDVDHFKRYNDHYGHPQGDACLIRIGTILKAGLARQTDLAARYGGEEFAILLSRCALGQATAFAQALCASVKDGALEHVNRGDGLGLVTISAGVACIDENAAADARGELLAAADRALYTAKSFGRNRAVAAAGSRAGAALPPASGAPLHVA